MNIYQPTPNAIVFFNAKDLNNWTTRDGKPAAWKVEDGILPVVPGTGDIMTRERLTDFFLHLECRCPDMPEAEGQAKGNKCMQTPNEMAELRCGFPLRPLER